MHCVRNGSGLKQAEGFPKVFQRHDKPTVRLFAHLARKIFEMRNQVGMRLYLSRGYPDTATPARGK
jgi:hypothetical protein